MVRYIVTTLATAIALLVVDLIVPGVSLNSFLAAILAGVVIGAINGSIKPILSILSLPITILTLGLFALFVNGFCFWLASLFVPGFVVAGPVGFILGPIVLSLVSAFLNRYLVARGDKLLATGQSTTPMEGSTDSIEKVG